MNRERDETMAKIEGNLIARAVIRAFKNSWNNPAERAIIEARMERDRLERQASANDDSDTP